MSNDHRLQCSEAAMLVATLGEIVPLPLTSYDDDLHSVNETNHGDVVSETYLYDDDSMTQR